jgi:hypothetical protein
MYDGFLKFVKLMSDVIQDLHLSTESQLLGPRSPHRGALGHVSGAASEPPLIVSGKFGERDKVLTCEHSLHASPQRRM